MFKTPCTPGQPCRAQWHSGFVRATPSQSGHVAFAVVLEAGKALVDKPGCIVTVPFKGFTGQYPCLIRVEVPVASMGEHHVPYCDAHRKELAEKKHLFSVRNALIADEEEAQKLLKIHKRIGNQNNIGARALRTVLYLFKQLHQYEREVAEKEGRVAFPEDPP